MTSAASVNKPSVHQISTMSAAADAVYNQALQGKKAADTSALTSLVHDALRNPSSPVNSAPLIKCFSTTEQQLKKAEEAAAKEFGVNVVSSQLFHLGKVCDNLRYARILDESQGKEKECQALIKAAQQNDVQSAEKLISAMPNPDCAITQWEGSGELIHGKSVGATALGVACGSGSKDMVALLMSNNADPNFAVMSSGQGAEIGRMDLVDFSEPTVMPAWMVLLTAKLPHQIKKEIWELFQGKANPLLRNGHGWWLTRCFYSTNMQREDLQMALLRTPNVPELSAQTGVDDPDVNCGLMAQTFRDLPKKAFEAELEQRVVMKPKQLNAWHEHTIKLGAVLIFNGSKIGQVFSHLIMRVIKRSEGEFIVDNWISKRVTLSNGNTLSLRSAVETHNAQKVKEEKRVTVLNEAEAKQLSTHVNGALEDLPNVLRNIVLTYCFISPAEFQSWLARICFNKTFNPKK